MTRLVGFAGCQNLVVARNQPHFSSGDGIGRGQRIDEDVDAVIAGERREPEIGNDEPLRRQRSVVVAARAFGRGRHDVDTRLQIAERLIDRKRRGDVLIERGGGGEFTRPDLYAALVAEAGEFVFAEGALKIAVDHGVDQVAVADPKHAHGYRRGVDADQWDSALAGARQHIGAPGEAHERLAVAHIDIEFSRFRQGLLDGGWQPGAQIDVEALAVLQAVDAKLLSFRRQSRLVAAGQRQERREVSALGEILGELETGPRRGRVGIHGIIEQAKTMLVAHLFILAAHLGDLAQVERESQRIQRRAPQLAFGHRTAEHGERICLFAGVAGALIGDVGRGRGPLQEEDLLAGVLRRNLEDDAGQPEPVAAIFRRGGGDLPEDLQAGPEVAAPEGRVGVDFQCRIGFGYRSGFALDPGFQLDS